MPSVPNRLSQQGSPVPFEPEVQALLVGGRLSFRGAVVYQACLRWRGASLAFILVRGARAGLSEEETRAGISEAMLAGFLDLSGNYYWTAQDGDG